MPKVNGMNIPTRCTFPGILGFEDAEKILRLVNPGFKVKHLGYIRDRHVGMIYLGNLTDRANRILRKSIEAEITEFERRERLWRNRIIGDGDMENDTPEMGRAAGCDPHYHRMK